MRLITSKPEVAGQKWHDENEKKGKANRFGLIIFFAQVHSYYYATDLKGTLHCDFFMRGME